MENPYKNKVKQNKDDEGMFFVELENKTVYSIANEFNHTLFNIPIKVMIEKINLCEKNILNSDKSSYSINDIEVENLKYFLLIDMIKNEKKFSKDYILAKLATAKENALWNYNKNKK